MGFINLECSAHIFKSSFHLSSSTMYSVCVIILTPSIVIKSVGSIRCQSCFLIPSVFFQIPMLKNSLLVLFSACFKLCVGCKNCNLLSLSSPTSLKLHTGDPAGGSSILSVVWEHCRVYLLFLLYANH